jgi:hypothetical protein
VLGFFFLCLFAVKNAEARKSGSLRVLVTVQLTTEGDPTSGSQEAKKLDGQLEMCRSHALVDVDPVDCYAVDNPRACAAQRVSSVIVCVPKVLWTLAQKVARRGRGRN